MSQQKREILAGGPCCGGEGCPTVEAVEGGKNHVLVTGRIVDLATGSGEATVELPTEILHKAAAKLLLRGSI